MFWSENDPQWSPDQLVNNISASSNLCGMRNEEVAEYNGYGGGLSICVRNCEIVIVTLYPAGDGQGIAVIWNATAREICHCHVFQQLPYLAIATYFDNRHTLTIATHFKLPLDNCHIFWQLPHLTISTHPDNTTHCDKCHALWQLPHIWQLPHALTISFLQLKTFCRRKGDFALKENCRMKTNPGSKTQSGLNNGIFFHSKLLSQHHFLCLPAKRGRADPFPNYLATIKRI